MLKLLPDQRQRQAVRPPPASLAARGEWQGHFRGAGLTASVLSRSAPWSNADLAISEWPCNTANRRSSLGFCAARDNLSSRAC
mmetsp:Transcript_3840/g.15890  ORF Transcript_3840/g.15890 Transcript_3840/m.15890 type:complete len:83 (-) Transcript_3840:148-396(-)